jgi:recombination protein RecR
MKLQELLARLGQGVIKEVIIATGSTVEGDATALYVAKLVADFGVQSTRLAQGMPKGGELEYADEVTLSRAFSGRTAIGA